MIIFQWSANKYCLKLLNLSKIRSNISFFRKQNKNVYLQRIFCWNGVYEINNLDSFCKSSFFEVTRNRFEILLYPAISSSRLFHRFALFPIRLSRSSLVDQLPFEFSSTGKMSSAICKPFKCGGEKDCVKKDVRSLLDFHESSNRRIWPDNSTNRFYEKIAEGGGAAPNRKPRPRLPTRSNNLLESSSATCFYPKSRVFFQIRLSMNKLSARGGET